MSPIRFTLRVYRPLTRRRPSPLFWSCHQHRATSSDASTNKAADDAIAVDGAAAKKEALAAQCLQPRPIFPWRSSPMPLERLVMPSKPSFKSDGSEEDEMKMRALLDEYYESDYFAKGGPLGPGWPSPMEPWFRWALHISSMNLLGVSWASAILPWTRRDWEHEMGWNFCQAFSVGVRGMVEDTYILPENKVVDDNKEKSGGEDQDGKVKSDADADESDAYDVNMQVTLDPIPLDERNGDSATPLESSGENHDEYSMLQENLRELYQSARQHSHPSKVNVLLRTMPQSAQIESMFPVFGMSRTLVEDHPNIRHTYRNLVKRLRQKHKDAISSGKKRLSPIEVGQFIMAGLKETMDRSANLSGDGYASVTIVAQVSINCKEVFCVRDIESGEIIQGWEDGQPRDVTHLVRFEMVVRENIDDVALEEGDWEMEIGRWQITDWDDLLEGNVFFT